MRWRLTTYFGRSSAYAVCCRTSLAASKRAISAAWLCQERKALLHDLDVCAVPRMQRCVLASEGHERTLGVVIELDSFENVAVLGGAVVVCLQQKRAAADEMERLPIGAQRLPFCVDFAEEEFKRFHWPP